MANLRVEELVPGVSCEQVWATIVRIDAYPAFMDQVVAVEVLHGGRGQDGVERESAWTALFNGNELRWTQRDRTDGANHTLYFEQIEGDLAVWRGSTKVAPVSGGACVVYEIEFDLGVPALAHLLHPLAERAIRANCEQMLSALAGETSRAGAPA